MGFSNQFDEQGFWRDANGDLELGVGADIGGSFTKAATATREVVFPSAVVEISQAEYERILQLPQSAQAASVFLDNDNGQAYMFGDYAVERVPYSQRPKGRDRYSDSWYKRLAQAALCLLYNRTQRNIVVCATFAPQDYDIAPEIADLWTGEFNLTYKGKFRNYEVKPGLVADEPIAAMRYQQLQDNGLPFERPPDYDPTDPIYAMLYGTEYDGVFDAGGYTNDKGTFDENGWPIVSTFQSDNTYGIEALATDARELLWREKRDKFGARRPLQSRVHEALRTGIYRGGGGIGDIRVSSMWRDLLTRYDNTVYSVYIESELPETFGLYVVGGGSFLVWKRLRKEHKTIYPLGFDPDNLQDGAPVNDRSMFLAAVGAYKTYLATRWHRYAKQHMKG